MCVSCASMGVCLLSVCMVCYCCSVCCAHGVCGLYIWLYARRVCCMHICWQVFVYPVTFQVLL